MKKLFLYIAFFGLIFWAGFIILRDIYRNKDYAYEIITTEQEQTILPAETSIQAEQDSRKNERLFRIIGLSADYDFPAEATDAFTVTIKQDSVVVYDESECIYEYTGIDAELIKALNSTLYHDLMNGLHFESLEDLYRFLESISS